MAWRVARHVRFVFGDEQSLAGVLVATLGWHRAGGERERDGRLDGNNPVHGSPRLDQRRLDRTAAIVHSI
jgi:hypothetical protein